MIVNSCIDLSLLTRAFTFLICILVSQGCSPHKRFLEESKLSEPIPLAFFQCDDPYKLTNGCYNHLFVAVIRTEINDRKFAISSNDEGNILVISKRTSSRQNREVVNDVTYGLVDAITKSLNEDVNLVMDTLSKEGVNVVEIRALTERSFPFLVNKLHGYLLRLDGNGFEVLFEYIDEPNYPKVNIY